MAFGDRVEFTRVGFFTLRFGRDKEEEPRKIKGLPNKKISQTLIPLCPLRLCGSLIRIIYFLEVPKTREYFVIYQKAFNGAMILLIYDNIFVHINHRLQLELIPF